MSETTATAPANKVTISDAGPSRKKVAVEIPAETVDGKLRESLDVLSSEAAIPGFRKGRAPQNIIERRFGSAIRDQAKQELIASAYSAAIEEHGLKVLGEPSEDAFTGVEVAEGKPLTFEVEVEVQPEFDLPSLDGISIDKPVIEVSDDSIEKELEKILVNEGTLEQHDHAEPGDYLTGLAVMTGDADGEEFYNIDGAVVRVPERDSDGSGMILGIVVPDLAAVLDKPAVGDSVTIKATGPENHEVETLRGTKVTITFRLDRIDRIVPASIEQLLSTYGLADEAQFRETVRTRLEQRALVEQRASMRRQITDYLVEQVQIDLPERATALQAQRTLERRRMELLHRGVDPSEIERHVAQLRSTSDEVAVRELKLFFILNRVAEELGVTVEESEINGRIAQIAFETERRPEQLRQELVQSNRIAVIFQQIRDHKAIDAIIDKADINELDPVDFQAFMLEQAARQ